MIFDSIQGLASHFVFYWKPHLQNLFPLNLLEQEAKHRIPQALIIKAYVKMSFVRNLMIKTRPYCDRRQAIFRIKRSEYTSPKCKFVEPIFDTTKYYEIGQRLFRYQDRIEEADQVLVPPA